MVDLASEDIMLSVSHTVEVSVYWCWLDLHLLSCGSISLFLSGGMSNYVLYMIQGRHINCTCLLLIYAIVLGCVFLVKQDIEVSTMWAGIGDGGILCSVMVVEIVHMFHVLIECSRLDHGLYLYYVRYVNMGECFYPSVLCTDTLLMWYDWYLLG